MLGLGGPSTGFRPMTGVGYVPGSGGVPTASTIAPPTSHPTLSPDELDTAKDNAPGTAKPPTTGTRRTAAAIVTSIDEILPGFSRPEPPPAPAPVVEASAPVVAAPEPVAEVVPEPIVEAAPEPVAEVAPEPVAEVAPPVVEEPAPAPEPAVVEPAAEQLPPPIQPPASEPAAFEPDYEALTQRGLPQDPPTVQKAPPPQPPASAPKPGASESPAFAPHLTVARTTPAVSAPAPVSSPSRKGPPKVLLLLSAAIVAIGLGAWMAMVGGNDSGGSDSANPPPIGQELTPTPTYEQEIEAVRQHIAAGRIDDATTALASLPSTAPQRGDLERLIADKRKEMSDAAAAATAAAEAAAAAKVKINSAIATVDAAMKARKWSEAREAIAALNALDPNSNAAAERLSTIAAEETKDKEAAKLAMQKIEQERIAAANAEQERQAKAAAKAKADEEAAEAAAERKRQQQMIAQQEERDRRNRAAAIQREREQEEAREAARKKAVAKKSTPRPQPAYVAPPKPDPTPAQRVIVKPPTDKKPSNVMKGTGIGG
jgi:hypothetical protein